VPEAIEQFQKELSVNPGMRLRFTSWRTPIRAFKNTTMRNDCCNARSGWTQLPPAIHSDGKSSSKKGEFELAVRALRRAAAMDPNNPMTHHLLGQTYRDMGKKEDAENELKLAEQLQSKQGSHQ